MVRTALLVAAVTAAATAIGVPLAWLVARTDLPGRRVWSVLFALPLVIPSYVTALALISALGPRGLLQVTLAGPLGLDRVPGIYGFPGAFAALTLATYPYVYLLVGAALRRADPALEEASRSLGLGPWPTFVRATLPALRPSIGAGALLVALYSLSDFGVVSLMRYDALTRAIFTSYRSLFDRNPAAVIGLVLVAMTVVVLVLEARTRGPGARGRGFRQQPGSERRAAPVALGRGRPVALVAGGLVVTVALIVPVGVLVYWAQRSLTLDELHASEVASAALHSLLASGLAGVAAVLAGLPVAALAVRFGRRWTVALESLCYSASSLPGIVIALALVFFAARYVSPLYQTLWLLVVAYVVRFLPQALGGTRAALMRVDPHLEEAARGLGRSPRGVFATVTAPLVAPGLLVGATLVFLSTMKELPVTLLLRPIGFDTLATELWTATSVASYSEAAIPALLLVGVSAPVLWFTVARPASLPPE